MAVLRCSYRIVTSQINVYVYMYMSVCVLIDFFCLRPSWKNDVLSNEWPLQIKCITLVIL